MTGWLALYADAVRAAFPCRIVFIGLQGSRGRGEADEASDIDTVLILDKLDFDDLTLYRGALDTLPEHGKLCGFVCGLDELDVWERSDLLSLWLDTVPYYGTLDFMRGFFTDADLSRALHTAACDIYHACCHNYLHEQSEALLRSIRKSVFFALRLEYYYRRGVYYHTKAQLSEQLDENERALIDESNDFDLSSRLICDWSKKEIARYSPRRHTRA